MRFGASDKERRFERVVMPHLPAAYNLARWLLHDADDAEDVVQEACLRAFRFLDRLRGDDGRAWLLAIVRNTSFTWLEKTKSRDHDVPVDDETLPDGRDAELAVHAEIDLKMLRRAMARLPVEFREAILLRDLEGLSYKEIAAISGVPIGTVMSRLARGRDQLRKAIGSP